MTPGTVPLNSSRWLVSPLRQLSHAHEPIGILRRVVLTFYCGHPRVAQAQRSTPPRCIVFWLCRWGVQARSLGAQMEGSAGCPLSGDPVLAPSWNLLDPGGENLFPAHLGSWQNSDPCGPPISVLAVCCRTFPAPTGRPHVLSGPFPFAGASRSHLLPSPALT